MRGVRRNHKRSAAGVDDAWLPGSTSEVMTVALIARLVEQGMLTWETPLQAMPPDQANTMNPACRDVTLVQLLPQRAGLPENPRDRLLSNRSSSTSGRCRSSVWPTSAARARRSGRPRKALHSFTATAAFLIAGVIAERFGKDSFEALMRRELFLPLAMQSAGFGAAPAGQPPVWCAIHSQHYLSSLPGVRSSQGNTAARRTCSKGPWRPRSWTPVQIAAWLAFIGRSPARLGATCRNLHAALHPCCTFGS